MVSRTINTRPNKVVIEDLSVPRVIRNGEIVALLTGGVNAHYRGVKKRTLKLATSRQRQYTRRRLAELRCYPIGEIEEFGFKPNPADEPCIGRRCVA